MDFEYDTRKSVSNRKKHGIDFVGAQRLWDDPDSLEIPLETTDEARFLVIGKIDDILWSAIFTYRSQKIRTISVRRSRRKEIDLYES